MSSPEPRLLTSTGNVDDRRQPAKEAPRSPLPHDSPPPLFPRSRRLTDPHPYRRRFRGSFNDSHQCLSSAAAAEAARPEAAARPLERHTLLRFLIDSRQIETHPYLVPFFSSSAAVAEASPRPAPSVASQLLTGIEVSENTQICWIPTDKRRSWTFILYPSEHGSKGGWWRKLLTYASYVLLAGPDAYEVPEDKQEKEGVLLYEIPFPGISGMDYSNNITSDGRWCIETREVYKAWFPNDTALDDFVNHRIVPQSILTLAGAVAAQVVGCLRAEVPAPAQEQCLVWLRAVSVERCDTADAASTERRHLRWLAEEVCDSVHGDGGDGDGDGDAAMQDRQSEDGTASLQSPLPATWAGRPRSTFMKRSLSDSMLGQRSDAASSDSEASAAEPENVEPPAPPVEFSLIHTNLVVLYFGDDSAPLLPFSLWKILMDKNNSEYLRQVESGLPSWCMFLSQRNIYYRTWIRSVVQTISIVWPIVTLIAALLDLYRSYETIRDIVSYVNGGVHYAEDMVYMVFVFCRGLLWALCEPFVTYVWFLLSDWWQSVVLTVLGHVSSCTDVVGQVLHFVWEQLCALPIVSQLAATKAYLVSMLLPFVADVVAAVVAAARLWLQAIINMWKVVTGSAVAVYRVITSVAFVPKWLANTLTQTFSGLQMLFSETKVLWVYQQLTSLFKWRHSVATVNATAADTAIRWTMFNSARQVIAGVVSRTWNLTIFVGTEICKHWETWVRRPAYSFVLYLQDNLTELSIIALAFLPFGPLSHVVQSYQSMIQYDVTPNERFFMDISIYVLCYFVTQCVYPLLSLRNIGALLVFLVKNFCAGAVAYACYEELSHDRTELRGAKRQLLALTLIVTFGCAVYQVLHMTLTRMPFLQDKEEDAENAAATSAAVAAVAAASPAMVGCDDGLEDEVEPYFYPVDSHAAVRERDANANSWTYGSTNSFDASQYEEFASFAEMTNASFGSTSSQQPRA